MNKLKAVASFLIFSVSVLNAQIQINLSGTIINQASAAVKQMIVVLAGTGFSDTSDSQGKFVVIGQNTAIVSGYEKNKLDCVFTGRNFFLSVPDGMKRISIAVYDLKGTLLMQIMKNEEMTNGRHSIPIVNKINTLSSSVFIVVIRYGQTVSRYRIVKTGYQNYFMKEFAQKNSGYGNQHDSRVSPFSADAMALDSLRFIRRGKVEFSIPVTKWIDKFEVKLDLIPYEIVDVGLNEWNLKHIWPDQVGTTITEYPGKLTNYLNKTGTGPHDYEAWCSEFYSWCNRVGGYPFGNDQGSTMDPNWMIDAHTNLRTWFESKKAYVTKELIADSGYVPAPGDFMHLSEYNGHTAMVWYLSKDTVYTIEGNYVPLNQMKVWSRGPYKTVETLYGYGRRSGIYGSSYKSISGR